MSEDLINEKFNQHTKELEEHDKRISDLEKTYIIMQKMDLRVGNIEKSVGVINNKLDKQTKVLGKLMDKFFKEVGNE